MESSPLFWLQKVRQQLFKGLESRNETTNGEEPLQNQKCQEPDYKVYEETFATIPDWTEALLAVGNIIIIIFSVCGNIGALLVISKSKMSKKSTKRYLISLALCDLILTLTSPTVDLSQLMTRYRAWILGKFLCKVIPFLQTLAIMGVAFSLVIIAMERYLLVILSFDSPSTKNSCWKDFIPTAALILIWTLSIGSGIPHLWYYEIISFWTYIRVNGTDIRPRNETCETYYICNRTTFDANNGAYYFGLGFVTFLLTAVFAFCYTSIILFVRKHGHFKKQAPSSGSNRVVRNRKTLRLILGLILLYLICRVPLWTFVIITTLKTVESTTTTLILFYGFHLLSNINSLANPFIYAIFNDSIRSSDTKGNTGKNSAPRKKYCFSSICFEEPKNPVVGDNLPSLSERNNNNRYDLTKQSKDESSVSTQRFQMTERNEFVSPFPK